MSETELQQIATWVRVIGGVIGASAAVFAVIKGLSEWRRTNERREQELDQKRLELRHSQAVNAKQIVESLFTQKESKYALTMLTWVTKSFKDENGVEHAVSRSNIKKAMQPKPGTLNSEFIFIRQSFEALYLELEQIESLIRLEIIKFGVFQGSCRV